MLPDVRWGREAIGTGDIVEWKAVDAGATDEQYEVVLARLFGEVHRQKQVDLTTLPHDLKYEKFMLILFYINHSTDNVYI